MPILAYLELTACLPFLVYAFPDFPLPLRPKLKTALMFCHLRKKYNIYASISSGLSDDTYNNKNPFLVWLSNGDVPVRVVEERLGASKTSTSIRVFCFLTENAVPFLQLSWTTVHLRYHSYTRSRPFKTVVLDRIICLQWWTMLTNLGELSTCFLWNSRWLKMPHNKFSVFCNALRFYHFSDCALFLVPQAIRTCHTLRESLARERMACLRWHCKSIYSVL